MIYGDWKMNYIVANIYLRALGADHNLIYKQIKTNIFNIGYGGIFAYTVCVQIQLGNNMSYFAFTDLYLLLLNSTNTVNCTKYDNSYFIEITHKVPELIFDACGPETVYADNTAKREYSISPMSFGWRYVEYLGETIPY